MYAFLAACYNNASEVVIAYRRELEETAERARLHRIREEEERQRRYERQRKERQEWVERHQQEEKRRQEREEHLQKERAAAFESQRLQRLLEEQARQELKDRQHADRIQAEKAQAEIERIRKEEERKVQVLEDAMDELTEDTDFYIRTRRRFDSRIPQAFFCDLSSVAQDPAVITSLADVNRFSVEVGYDEISLREFIEFNESFVLQGNKIGVRNLTPFQGAVAHRVYGYFCCFSCKRDWQSAATYTDKWQKCKTCNGECYPYEQHVLERSQEQSDNLRPHDTRRCQRCLELGRLCLPNRYVAIKLR